MATRRSLLLERAAVVIGEGWARSWLADLRSEGRAAAGGWPGTLSQARSRVRAYVASGPSRAELASAGADEVDRTARSAYAKAKEVWLASAKADDDAEDAEEALT